MHYRVRIPSPLTPNVDLRFERERDLGGRATVIAEVDGRPIVVSSLSCLPADACESISVSDAATTWVPVRTAYELVVTAGGVQAIRPLSAVSPGARIFSRPAAALAGATFAFCLVGVAAASRTTIDLDGVPVNTASTPPCANAVFERAGTAHLVTRLSNGLELGRVDVPVHDFTEPDAAFEVQDQRCPDQTDAFFARSAGATWNVLLAGTASFPDGSAFPAPIEATYRDTAPVAASGTGALIVSFAGPPSASATLEVVIGRTRIARPVRSETVALCR